MVERVQKTHSTTLFVASVGNTRFGPTDGTMALASLHSHNEDSPDLQVARVSGRLIGSRGDGATRTQ